MSGWDASRPWSGVIFISNPSLPTPLEFRDAESLLLTPFDHADWVVEDLVSVGLTLLVGGPKVGKSWAALDLADRVSKGESWLGFATRRSDVLYLALEDQFPRLQTRLFRLADEASIGLRIAVQAATLGTGLVQQVGQFLDTFPETRLVIVDTLQVVRDQTSKSAYSADYSDVRLLKTLADEYGVALLAIHHTRKMAASDVFDTVSGTNGLMGAADTTMMLIEETDERRDPSSEKTARLTAKGRDIRGIDLRLGFRDCRWSVLENLSDDIVMEPVAPQEVENVLALVISVGSWSGTATELVGAVGCQRVSPAVLGKRLNEFRDFLLARGVSYSQRHTAHERTILLEAVPLDDGE